MAYSNNLLTYILCISQNSRSPIISTNVLVLCNPASSRTLLSTSLHSFAFLFLFAHLCMVVRSIRSSIFFVIHCCHVLIMPWPMFTNIFRCFLNTSGCFRFFYFIVKFLSISLLLSFEIVRLLVVFLYLFNFDFYVGD